MKNMVILGAGLSGISLAYFLRDRKDIEKITILEREDHTGGLCHSIHKDGYTYDIGPHILFSKDKEMLNLMLDMIGNNRNDLRRSNQIIYKGRWVQYPFENDLSKLPKEDLDYCVSAFKSNPYENYEAENMLQFFLKTFGEGITNTYLRPYNEKIWKYDPSFMDTQMVERIPKPTHDDIMRSASGETVDGYVHQLYFSFPARDGIEAVVNGFKDRLGDKTEIRLDQNVSNVVRDGNGYIVTSNDEEIKADKVISTIPIQEFAAIYKGTTEDIKAHVDDLHYNSIIIAFVKTKKDLCGNNFAFMNPEKDIIFHRISKMDFLGENYHHDGATYMVEVTYRKNDHVDILSDDELKSKIVYGLKRINFIEDDNDAEFINITRHQYAYVIYDLHHKENMTAIREFYSDQGVILNGRFGNFEYWNMDRIIRESLNVSERI